MDVPRGRTGRPEAEPYSRLEMGRARFMAWISHISLEAFRVSTYKTTFVWISRGYYLAVCPPLWDSVKILISYPCSPHHARGRKIQPGQKLHISVAFCDEKYRPKATLPDEGTNDWAELVGLGNRKTHQYHLWRIKDEPLFELDIFDSNHAEDVIKVIENELDNTGGLHHLTIMVNSSYEVDPFMSSSIY